jgi:hypothetical protein
MDGAAVIFISPKTNNLDYFRENVNIVVQDLTDVAISLQSYTDLVLDQMARIYGDNIQILESNPLTIAGEPGHKIIFIGKGPDLEMKYMITWMMKDTKAYQITYTSEASQYDQYMLYMEMITRSFRLR